jgi:protein subunit release factor B
MQHVPTGLQVRCQESRSQHENRRIGRKLMQQKLEVFVLGDQSKAMQKVAKVQKAKRRRRKRAVARHSQSEGDANDDTATEAARGSTHDR